MLEPQTSGALRENRLLIEKNLTLEGKMDEQEETQETEREQLTDIHPVAPRPRGGSAIEPKWENGIGSPGSSFH